MAYCRKNKIFDEVKIFIEDKFNGMTDGIDPVNEEGTANYSHICEKGKYGRHLYYDTNKKVLRAVSFALGSWVILDERFNGLIELAKKMEMLKNLEDKKNGDE